MVSRIRVLATIALLFGLANAAFAIPQYIAISGVLTDSNNNPTSGTFQVRVFFHDVPDLSKAIASYTTTTQFDRSLFSVIIPVPEELLTLERAWYSVSIDVNKNGFDPGDKFPKLNQIVSVPFSLAGKPVDIFETSGGHKLSFILSISGPFVPNTLVVVPFSTPPGGVRFNRLAIRSLFPGFNSYGIYDTDGKLVISTDKADPNWMADPFIFNISSHLKPSTIYFAAYTTTADRVSTRLNLVPTIPGVGRIINGGVNGKLPATIDFSQVQPLDNEPTLSYGLYYVEEDSPLAAPTAKMSNTSQLAPEIQQMIAEYKAATGAK